MEDCTVLDWEAVLELDEALAGWFLKAPVQGDWGWEWSRPASHPQEQQHHSEGIPAVSEGTEALGERRAFPGFVGL